MKTWHLWIAIALALTGCQTDARPLPISDLEITRAKLAVANTLRDPESARFVGRIFKLQTKNGTEIVCGKVNAKNGFGGYGGPMGFGYIVNTDTAYIFGQDDTNMSLLNPESLSAVNECSSGLIS